MTVSFFNFVLLTYLSIHAKFYFFPQGGESAILAAAGSVIGLGNDLAGSIRVPCMFCGLFGHKATRGELI